MIETGKKKRMLCIQTMTLIVFFFSYNDRYANDPVYSDDDMEANASEVLREEKRR
jgi:hypothetical protein